MRKVFKIRPTKEERIFLMDMAYKILKKGYHTDPYRRLDGIDLEISPYNISKVYKELIKCIYE